MNDNDKVKDEDIEIGDIETFDISELDLLIPDEQDLDLDIYGVPAKFTVKYLTVVECLCLSGNETLVKEVVDLEIANAIKRKQEEDAETAAEGKTDDTDNKIFFQNTLVEEKIKHAVIQQCVIAIDGKPVTVTESQARKLPVDAKQKIYNAGTGNGEGGNLLRRFRERNRVSGDEGTGEGDQ